MNRIICIPFAWEKQMQSGVNLSVEKDEKLIVYLKNVSVACVSAKKSNPKAKVFFVTNLSECEISVEIRRILREAGVDILTIAFDCFRFSDDYTWSLAFYKLCILKHMCKQGFDSICYLDTDVYIQGNFDAIWEETKHNILLYDINHGLNTEDYKIICEEFRSFNGSDRYITHYGGEFFASNLENAKRFISICEKIYIEMQKRSFETTKGDEFVLSLAADQIRERVKNAGAYIYRFWTGTRFRLTSTCYEYNRVLILHLPAEKEKGIIKLYQRYISKGRIPSDRKVWSICRLYHRTFKDFAAYLLLSILKK